MAENSFITAHCKCSDSDLAWRGVVNRPIPTLTQPELSAKQNN